ncbi:flagellar filament capping protein FliD [Motiliproteus sp. MSK22-1]|uniref:flagellar filament capping protein FliD n=1 Tax=Motiliproteus sp. MSK22-1 TaxID=1897630 RepID=UPI000976AF73|nr:flagellar filament capping protein FliD [Motiliproteus sp. MSK22-1]OMH30014.1 hypothetical protein BGP75_18975 [Motiliproteus sp. MSK22-1]
MVDNIVTTLGAGSGIDTKKLVDDLVTIERAPKEALLNSRKETLDAQISGYGAIRSSMSSLQDSLSALGDSDTFNGKSVSFPTTDVLTPASIDAEALSGDFEVEVRAIAKAHSLASTSFSSPTDAVGKGTLTFTLGAWDAGFTAFSADASKSSQVITIDDSNNTLTGLRDAINEADFGVQASIVQNGSTYQLLLTAPSGASNELEIVVDEEGGADTNNDASDLSRFAFNTAGSQLASQQSGADSQVVVNGLVVDRESNHIDDVITGLEFTIHNTNVGETVAISITDDKSLGEQSIRDFVTAYNSFLTETEALIRPAGEDSEEGGTDGSLLTDPTAKTMVSQVRSLISQTLTGLSGGYVSLVSVGITTELDGTLSIDEDDLRDAIDNNFSKVIDLFAPSTATTDSQIEIARFKSTTTPGSYEVNVTTQPAKGFLDGSALTISGFNAGTEDFTPDFDASSGDYSFKIKVDGTESDTVTLTGNFSDTEELRAKLQSLINGDTNLQGVGAEVDVAYNATTDAFEFTSRTYGSASKIEFTTLGTDAAELGISLGSGTVGVDVAGTIDGKSAFGSGNILLPDLSDTALAGLSVKVGVGASSATITYARGFSSEMDNILETYLSSNGLIDSREENISDELKDIEKDNDALDVRMETRRAMLEAQFIAMERIITSISQTSDSLDGILDRLPFTARSS